MLPYLLFELHSTQPFILSSMTQLKKIHRYYENITRLWENFPLTIPSPHPPLHTSSVLEEFKIGFEEKFGLVGLDFLLIKLADKMKTS